MHYGYMDYYGLLGGGRRVCGFCTARCLGFTRGKITPGVVVVQRAPCCDISRLFLCFTPFWLLLLWFITVRSVGYTGALVHVAITSPCPSFNRGKNAPGGGRSSRSPPTENIFALALTLS